MTSFKFFKLLNIKFIDKIFVHVTIPVQKKKHKFNFISI